MVFDSNVYRKEKVVKNIDASFSNYIKMNRYHTIRINNNLVFDDSQYFHCNFKQHAHCTHIKHYMRFT
jgi:hypothetical protein